MPSPPPPSPYPSGRCLSIRIVNRLIQCPLCGRHFPKSVVEFHAATCEGRREEGEEEEQQHHQHNGERPTRLADEEPEVLEVRTM